MINNNKLDAYDRIKGFVLSLEVSPGQNITENAISEMFNIGRTPVREALAKLEAEGLISSHKGRKTIYSLSFEEIKEIFEIKMVLEGAIVNWATQRGSAKDKKLLSDTIVEMMQLSQNRPEETNQGELYLKSWLEVDAKLHSIIFRMAKCKKAEDIIKKLNLQWHRTRVSVYALEGRTVRSSKEHETFVNYILAGDGDQAEAAMKSHLRKLLEEIEHVMKFFNYSVK
jgi:DNA-binding GntR family transcriptional regulator